MTTSPPAVRHLERAQAPTPWLGHTARLGMILLSVDRASEAELRRMLPAAVGEIYVSRVAMAAHCNLETLRAMETDISRAAANLLPGTRLDAIGFACTSGAAAIGVERVAECIAGTHPGVPVTTPLAAAAAGLTDLGVRRVSVLTPYIDEVNALISDGLSEAGFDIVDFASFHLGSDEEMSAVTPASLLEAGLQADHVASEALFISCTALRPAAVIDDLEQKLGKPVVTSHQAMLWHALACAGRNEPIAGYGRLLRQPGSARALKAAAAAS